MVYEFEGKTEQEAIDNAVSELGLQKDEFDVEIVEIQKGALFKKGYVKIRVHSDREIVVSENSKNANVSTDSESEKINEETIRKVSDFFVEIINRMGYTADISVSANTGKQVSYRLVGDDASYLIGKKGKTLDSLQLMGNIYLAKLGYPSTRVVLDCENYRIRREESLVRLAYDTADRVVSSKKSVLLEPMNPYERRLIHTTLSDVNYVETKSEGNGLYKQIRVIYKRR
ncbi:MAG: protein jag [Treponema sp.]|nr:MAG: protein jag [Treponema sp.]